MRSIARVYMVVGLAACAKADQAAKVDQRHDSVSVADTAKPEPPSVAFAADSESPRLVVDSAAKEPVLVLRNGEFVVRLPLDMARVLADNLPGFAPMKRAAFDTGLVRWRDHYADRGPPSLDPADSDGVWASALSVVVGDFNGDSKRDVAMEGIAGDTFAVFFLLSASDVKSRPVLLYFHPPQKGNWSQTGATFINYLTLVHPGKVGGFTEEGDPPLLDLHNDAVDYSIFEKASELYYIEKGVVQIFTTSD
jgi:hypothetical protein